MYYGNQMTQNQYQNQGYMMGYQPTYQSQYQQNQQTSLTRVTGIEGAKAYQMSPNSVTALFDANEDIMYIKTTDGAGFPTIRTFKFYEETNQDIKLNESDYVSKNEFETFKQEVVDYVQQFIQQQSSEKSTKQAISTNGISEQLGKSRDSISTDVSD